MKWLEVNSSKPLKGHIRVPGSKNSSLGLIAACCLSDEPVTLNNIPDIADIRVSCDIIEDLGGEVKKENNNLIINTKNISGAVIDPAKSSAFRASYYYIGSLLAKHKRVSVGYPGGDNFGSRPIDQHIKGFKAMGADIKFYETHYTIEAEELKGTDIYLDVIAFGPTINLMLAAVLAKGRTVLHNAARDPEVVDIAILLNKMGGTIYGRGTDIIRIEGVAQLGACVHTVIPDRLVAAAFMMAAGITNGRIILDQVIPEHLETCMDKLSEIGLSFETSDNCIIVTANSTLHAARVRAGMYPVFCTDYQQPLTSLLLKARGRSVITDRIWPERFAHCQQLQQMGADITVKSGSASILGGRPLYGALVHASDIRAGISLVLAGLIAEGTTYVTGVEHIERGYENIVDSFASLGADVVLREGDILKVRAEEQLLIRSGIRSC